jgi:transcriptional regulator of nitric oxide reductase
LKDCPDCHYCPDCGASCKECQCYETKLAHLRDVAEKAAASQKLWRAAKAKWEEIIADISNDKLDAEHAELVVAYREAQAELDAAITAAQAAGAM